MAKKKYLLHRITEEDAYYIAEDTNIYGRDINNGKCYLLVNKKNGKIFLENDHILIYKATGMLSNVEPDDKKRSFLEAIEACAFFRGYANRNDICFKTSKISELLYELEDHEIEVPDDCTSCRVVSNPRGLSNNEVQTYVNQAIEGFDILNSLQRNLPTLALFLDEPVRNTQEFDLDEEDIELEDR